MDKEQIKIKDALTIEYLDFIEYCSSIEKEFISDISTVDYIAFRTQFGVSKDYIAKIKSTILTYITELEQSLTKDPTICNSDSSTAKGSAMVDSCNEEDIRDSNKESSVTIFLSKTIIDDAQIDADTQLDTEVQIEQTEDLSIPLNKSENDCNYDEKFSFIYGIEPVFYSDINILDTQLSVRVKNALRRAEIKTVEDLFNLSESEIHRIKNLGANSFKEIRAFLDKKAAEYTEKINMSNKGSLVVGKSDIFAIKKSLLFLLGEGSQPSNALTEDENSMVDHYMDSIDVIGEEMALLVLKEPQTIDYFLSIFNDFLQESRIENGIKNRMPTVFLLQRRKDKIGPYVKAYYCCLNGTVPSELFEETISFEKFPSYAAHNILISNDAKVTKRFYDNFISWLAIDLNAQINRCMSAVFKDERLRNILNCRAHGDTLVQVGERLNVTRERVRQIEQKGIRRLRSWLFNQKCDFIMTIFALNGGEKLIKKDVFFMYVPSENADMLWAFVCAGYFDNSNHSYSNVYDAIIFPKEFEYGVEHSQNIATSFPDMLSIEEMENLISNAVQNQGVLEDKLRVDIDMAFIKYNTFYSKKKLSKQDITNIILKNRFKNGFKIADETYFNRFISYVKEDITEKELNYTQRGLDAKIPIKGVLCDRGTYLHTDYFDVPSSVLNGINTYIENSAKNVLTYGEIFDDNQELFIGTVILNKYCLQGALRKYGCEYTLRKDYLTKDASMSFLDEFENFVKESGTVHKSEIYSMFPTLDDLSLGNIMGRSKNVICIDNGYYIHSSQLNLLSNDYVVIRTILNKAVENLPINSRTVFDIFSSEYSDFLSRNNISDKSALFGVLQYMFGKEYTFSRPYIAKAEIDSVTNQSMLLSILEDFDSIQIEDLSDMIQEHNLSCRSLSYFSPLISPTFMLIDDDTFMRAECAGITEEVIEAVCEIVDEHMSCNDYFLTLDVDDFLWYPSINIEWTAKLLDSIIIASGKYDYIPLQSNRQGRNSLIVIAEKYKDMQYQDFVLAQVEEAYDKGFFSDKSEMKNWLIDKHFIEKGLPSFLESETYYYFDDFGVLRKR